MTPVRWGLLPVSGIAARAFAPAIANAAVAKALAVASRDLVKARTFALSHGIDRAYGSYDELLSDDEVEAVYISLPNALHAEWAIKALQSGKHVLCEKPLYADPDTVRRMFDAAERAGRLLMEAFMYRHHPDTAQWLAAARGAELGPIHHVRVALSFTMPGAVNVRLNPDLHGGALMDVGCYAIHALRALCGEPARVSGLGRTGPSGVDLRFGGWLQFPGGASGFFDCGLDLPSRSCLEVVGAHGTLRVDWPFFRPFFPHLDAPKIEVSVGMERRQLTLTDHNPYLAQIDNFSRAIRGLEQPLLGRADAQAQADVIDALRRSAVAQGGWMPVT